VSSPEEHQDERQDEQEPAGTLRPITGRALALCGVAGLVTGWALHPLGERISGGAPLVSWAQPLALFLVAGIMAFLAWHTWRTVHVLGRRLEVHHSVNRLVLARAGALAGALVAGGYAGFAITWLGDDSEPAQRWLLRSVVSALGALAVMLGSLALERACRARGGDTPP